MVAERRENRAFDASSNGGEAVCAQARPAVVSSRKSDATGGETMKPGLLYEFTLKTAIESEV